MKVINKTVDVIAFNKLDGQLIPHRMRVKTESGDRYTYTLHLIATDTLKEYGKDYIRYTCQFQEEERMGMCELHYYIEKTQWLLYKM